jgi:hypothetical protein
MEVDSTDFLVGLVTVITHEKKPSYLVTKTNMNKIKFYAKKIIILLIHLFDITMKSKIKEIKIFFRAKIHILFARLNFECNLIL